MISRRCSSSRKQEIFREPLGIKQILKTSSTLGALAKQDPLQWPFVKTVLSRVKEEDGGKKTYQGTVLKSYTSATLEYCKKQAVTDLERLHGNMRERLEWSDVELLRSLLVLWTTKAG